MTLLKFALLTVAALGAFAVAPAPASADSSPWRLEEGRRGRVSALSCMQRRNREVCAVVSCDRDGRLFLAIEGAATRGADGTARDGRVIIDRRSRQVLWVADDKRNGEERWVAELAPTRRFFQRMRAGYNMTVEIGQRRAFEFTLRGSSRSIRAVETACRGVG